MEFKKVGIVGSGIMGTGIAQVASLNNYDVMIRDIDANILKNSLAKIKKSLTRLEERGVLGKDPQQVIDRIKPTTELKDLKDCKLIIEAITEDLKSKQDLFLKLDEICAPDTVLASNTSQISISAIGGVTQRSENIIGMHWFNPVPVMKLVEIIPTVKTSENTIQEVEAFAVSCGKEVVRCRDSQGFIVSRAVCVFINECMRMLEEGVATREDIDKAIKLGLNHPMGPFELVDTLGLDTFLSGLMGLDDAFGDRFKPNETLKNMVRLGMLGNKTGSGYYSN